MDTARPSDEGIVSPEGLTPVISVGGGSGERELFWDASCELREVPSDSLLFLKCGHRASPQITISVWGNERRLKLFEGSIEEIGGEKVVESDCPVCAFNRLKQHSIRCCLCGYGIVPGDGVVLYHRSSRSINQAAATFAGDSAIGCMLWDCCPSGAFFAGHWSETGFKPAFSGRTMAGEAIASRSAVIANP